MFITPRSDLPRDPRPADAGPSRVVIAADGRFRFSAKDLTSHSLDGLPARRPAFLIATAEVHGPDWMSTEGQAGSSFISHWDLVKGALPDADAPTTTCRSRADCPAPTGDRSPGHRSN